MREFVVGKVAFSVEGSELRYRTTGFARLYQAYAAAGFVALFALGACIFDRAHPFGSLIGWPEAWDKATAIGLLAASITLLAGISIWLRRSAIQFVVDARGRKLLQDTRLLIDLAGADAVKIRKNSGLGGEYSGLPTWFVQISINGRLRRLELLSFNQPEEANRVAKEIADLIKVPAGQAPKGRPGTT